MVEHFYKLEVALNVRDRERARAWYAEKLGIHFNEKDRAEVAGVTMVMFPFRDAVPASHVIYQFVTPDLKAARQALLDRGGDVPEIDPYNWNLVFRDPDGNMIVFYEPRPWSHPEARTL